MDLEEMLYDVERHTTVTYLGEMYVIGGRRLGMALSTVSAYNVDNDDWSQKSSKNEARCDFQAGIANGFLFVLGGCGSRDPLMSVEKYSFSEDLWIKVANIQFHTKISFCKVYLNGLYIFIGGFLPGGAKTQLRNGYNR